MNAQREQCTADPKPRFAGRRTASASAFGSVVPARLNASAATSSASNVYTWLVFRFRPGCDFSIAASSFLVNGLFGSYQGVKLIGPSDSLPSVFRYWSSYQPGPMLMIAIGDQRCLTNSRVTRIASLRRLTTNSASAPVAFAFATSTDRSRADGSYAISSAIA